MEEATRGGKMKGETEEHPRRIKENRYTRNMKKGPEVDREEAEVDEDRILEFENELFRESSKTDRALNLQLEKRVEVEVIVDKQEMFLHFARDFKPYGLLFILPCKFVRMYDWCCLYV